MVQMNKEDEVSDTFSHFQSTFSKHATAIPLIGKVIHYTLL